MVTEDEEPCLGTLGGRRGYHWCHYHSLCDLVDRGLGKRQKLTRTWGETYLLRYEKLSI